MNFQDRYLKRLSTDKDAIIQAAKSGVLPEGTPVYAVKVVTDDVEREYFTLQRRNRRHMLNELISNYFDNDELKVYDEEYHTFSNGLIKDSSFRIYLDWD